MKTIELCVTKRMPLRAKKKQYEKQTNGQVLKNKDTPQIVWNCVLESLWVPVSLVPAKTLLLDHGRIPVLFSVRPSNLNIDP